MSASDRRFQAEQSRMSTQQRRVDAIVTAQNALRGAPLTRTDAKRVGEAFKDDMTAWRDTFQVWRAGWQAMRDWCRLDRDGRVRDGSARRIYPTLAFTTPPSTVIVSPMI